MAKLGPRNALLECRTVLLLSEAEVKEEFRYGPGRKAVGVAAGEIKRGLVSMSPDDDGLANPCRETKL